MTDIFKDLPEPNSNKIDSILTQELINKNVELFKKEMKDIGISDETIFIIFGKKAFEKFNKHFKNKLKNKIIYHRHYSSRGTDREWVEGFWEKFNIKSDYNTTVNKYGK
jgi:dihydrofolate reductase